MKVKELVKLINNDVIIYKAKENDQLDYEDLFKGEISNIPENLLNMEVKYIHARAKKIIDIRV